MTQDIMAWDVEDGVVLPHHSDEPVTGIHDVMQRVLCILLNETDSPCYTFGKQVPPTCDFMTIWRQGHIKNENDVIAHFNQAAKTIVSVLGAEAAGADPPEQRCTAIKLNRITIQPSAVALEITLETAAAAKDFILPLPT